MKILILIRALTAGGAERQSVVLAQGLRAAGHEAKIAVFYGGGVLEADLEGIPLIDLGKRGRWDILGFLWRLIRLLRREQPDILYSWLQVANLLAILVRPLVPRMKVAWTLRASDMDFRRYDWLVWAAARFEARLARFAHVIIANSRAGRDQAVRHGFPEGRLRVVPNGIDTRRFRPDWPLGRPLRAEWGIGEEEILIGLVGRLDPMKGHPVFLRAASRFGARHSEARFVCVGEGPEAYRQSLQTLTRDLGLGGRLVWAGNRVDMPAVYNALDISVSASSYGEGVSNMLGEAMASGVPCVATRVGDSPWVVGAMGLVVPPEDPAALAEGLEILLRQLREEGPELRKAVRSRIETELGVEAMVRNTLVEFEALLPA